MKGKWHNQRTPSPHSPRGTRRPLDGLSGMPKSPFIAALLAVIPGLGHFYLRDAFYGVLYFVFFWVAGLATFVYCTRIRPRELINFAPMIIFVLIWAYGIFDAYRDCIKWNILVGARDDITDSDPRGH